jgi:cobalamin synthase
MGVIAVVTVLALKFACAMSVDAFSLALPVTIYAGHASMALAVSLLPRDGSAAMFDRRRLFVVPTCFPALIVLPFLYPIVRRLGAITGDVCGAISEIAELVAWLILIGASC